MAMFPPAMPRMFIEWLTRPGEVVYDPFSGRGTAPFEACLMGRVGLGSDLNPLAWILTSAKVSPPEASTLYRRLRELRSTIRLGSTRHEAPHIRMLFSRRTLGQLVWLRENFKLDRKTDRFLLASLLGILHANADSSGRPRGLTVSMPNTFSMSPLYVERYIRDHKLEPPRVDVLDMLEERVNALGLPGGADFRTGDAWMQDAKEEYAGPRGRRARLVFTSPPYLHVILYGKFNWLRLWLLGWSRRQIDDALFTSSSLQTYIDFMSKVLLRIQRRVRKDGYACLVIGDVRRGDVEINLAREIARECVPATDFRVFGIVADRLPIEHKVSRIWGEKRGRATKTDRILVLGRPDAPVPGPVPTIAW